MKKHLSLRTILLSSALLLGAVGCSQQSDSTSTSSGANNTTSSGKQLTVGFAQVGAESAWRTAETESIKSEASKRNVNLKFSDAQGKQENQIKAVRGFIAQGVDAIILAPVVETGWEPVLQEAKRAKIPVVLVDRGIKDFR